MDVKNGDQVVTRIGFAERWLDRAKRQCTEGNLTRTALTLVLAGAEVHHALEATGAPVRRGTRRTASVTLVLLAAVLAAALHLASRWPVKSGATPSPVPRVVTLSSSSGALLEAIGTGIAGSVSAPLSSAGRAATAGRTADARYTSAFTSLREGAHQPSPLGRTSGISSVPVRSSHVSMSELIDLVLIAERALRQEPAGISSP